MSRILTSQEDIRQWATARAGNPMLMDTPDVHEDRRLLQITFGQHALNAERNEGPDVNPYGGWYLTDWDEWFVELDRQNLAIKVNDDEPGTLSNDFRFVSRNESEEDGSTDAARQPANIGIKNPNSADRSS